MTNLRPVKPSFAAFFINPENASVHRRNRYGRNGSPIDEKYGEPNDKHMPHESNLHLQLSSSISKMPQHIGETGTGKWISLPKSPHWNNISFHTAIQLIRIRHTKEASHNTINPSFIKNHSQHYSLHKHIALQLKGHITLFTTSSFHVMEYLKSNHRIVSNESPRHKSTLMHRIKIRQKQLQPISYHLRNHFIEHRKRLIVIPRLLRILTLRD